MEENENPPPIYDKIWSSDNSKSIIKFIFAQYCMLRQNYALHHDIPLDDVEEDEELMNISIVLFIEFKMENLQLY